MGENKGWWNARYKGIYIYGLSPFYQKAFPNFVQKDLVKMVKGGLRQIVILGPFVAGAYYLQQWAYADNDRRHRKAYLAEHGGH